MSWEREAEPASSVLFVPLQSRNDPYIMPPSTPALYTAPISFRSPSVSQDESKRRREHETKRTRAVETSRVRVDLMVRPTFLKASKTQIILLVTHASNPKHPNV